MIAIYLSCCIASIVLCIWYYLIDVRRSVVQNIMFLLLVAINFGYLSLALSTDISGAIISKKIVYLGACFLPMLYFFTVCEVCHFHIRKLFLCIFVFIQTVEFFFVCTIGYSELFYKNIKYINIDGVGSMYREYGPLHIMHPLTICFYFVASITVAIFTFVIKKNVEKTVVAVLICFLAIASTSYLIQSAFGNGKDFTPIIYIVLFIGAIFPIYKSDMYDIVDNDDVIRDQLNRAGFIAYDRKLHFMGANDYAMNLFEFLKKAEFGKALYSYPLSFEPIIKEVEIFLDESMNVKGQCHVEGTNFKINDKTYKTEIHSLVDHMKRCVGAILEIRDITEHVTMLELREKYNEQLEKEVWAKTEKIRTIQQRTILGMAQMVESRDLSTGGHIKRTSEVVRIFADKLVNADMGYNRHFLNLVIRSAPMHDLGKIGVDDAVLRKQGKFTDEEYEKMKKHSEIGGKMVTEILSGVEESEFVKVAFNVANYHHEKVNGKGYPLGLVGEEIPIEARIMALADVFDALVSKRCYKDAFSYDKAFSIITEDAGTHFDEKLVPIFLSCRDELEAYYDSENNS